MLILSRNNNALQMKSNIEARDRGKEAATFPRVSLKAKYRGLPPIISYCPLFSLEALGFRLTATSQGTAACHIIRSRSRKNLNPCFSNRDKRNPSFKCPSYFCKSYHFKKKLLLELPFYFKRPLYLWHCNGPKITHICQHVIL